MSGPPPRPVVVVYSSGDDKRSSGNFDETSAVLHALHETLRLRHEDLFGRARQGVSPLFHACLVPYEVRFVGSGRFAVVCSLDAEAVGYAERALERMGVLHDRPPPVLQPPFAKPWVCVYDANRVPTGHEFVASSTIPRTYQVPLYDPNDKDAALSWVQAILPQPVAIKQYTVHETIGLLGEMLGSAKLVDRQGQTRRVFAAFWARYDIECRRQPYERPLGLLKSIACNCEAAVALASVRKYVENARSPGKPQRKRVYTHVQLLALRPEPEPEPAPAPAPAPAPELLLAPIVDHASLEADAERDMEEEEMAEVYQREVLEPRERMQPWPTTETDASQPGYCRHSRRAAARAVRCVATEVGEAVADADPSAAPSADPTATWPTPPRAKPPKISPDAAARAAKDVLALRNAFLDDVWGEGGAGWSHNERVAAGWAAAAEVAPRVVRC